MRSFWHTHMHRSQFHVSVPGDMTEEGAAVTRDSKRNWDYGAVAVVQRMTLAAVLKKDSEALLAAFALVDHGHPEDGFSGH